MSDRVIGPVGTALLLENDRVRIWEMAPASRREVGDTPAEILRKGWFRPRAWRGSPCSQERPGAWCDSA
jgi:hypothetical protein